MDFKNILTQLDQLNESVEVVAEEAESENQATAARIALKHKEEGTKPKAGTASAEMMNMSKGDLEDFTKAKKGAPKKKAESFDAKSFRESFEAMVEAKSKPDFLDLDKDGNKKEPMKKAAKEAGKSKGGKKGMSDKQQKYFGKKDESVEEGKSPHKKGSAKYKKQMAAKHASMNEDKVAKIQAQIDELEDDIGELDFGSASYDSADAKLQDLHNQLDRAKKKQVNKSVNESFEKFLSKETMSFEEMVSVVQESGGQQKIDPIDDTLWQWANRVASNKGEGEMFAAKIYESNGGRFELHDVLSED